MFQLHQKKAALQNHRVALMITTLVHVAILLAVFTEFDTEFWNWIQGLFTEDKVEFPRP